MTLSLAWSVCLTPLTIRVFTTLQSDPRDLWPLRHLIRGMRRHYYQTNLQTYPPTYLPTYMPIYLPPLEPPDNHQEPPDNRQEPEDFYFWYTTSEPETCSQLFLNLLNFSLTFSTFFQLISVFLNFFSSILFNLWHLRHWLQHWQLRTWNHDNLCYLINCVWTAFAIIAMFKTIDTVIGFYLFSNFKDVCKKIFRRLYRVFVHVYIEHFERCWKFNFWNLVWS